MKPYSSQALAVGLLLLPAPALAQEGTGLEGLYFGALIGAGFIWDQEIDTDFTVTNLLNNASIDLDAETNVDHDTGIRFGGYVGYQLATNIRIQVEASYMKTDANNELEAGDNELDFDQKTEILSGTTGIFFDLWPVASFVPYVGVGAGIAKIEANIEDSDGVGDSKQTVLTAFAETGLPLHLTPGLAIVPSARFSWYNTKEESDEIVDVAGFLVAEADVSSIGKDLYETQLLVSARYSF